MLYSQRELTYPTFLFSHSWELMVFHMKKETLEPERWGGVVGALIKTGDGWAKLDLKDSVSMPNVSGIILRRGKINVICRMYDCLFTNLKHIRLWYVVNSKKMAIDGDQTRIFMFYFKYVGISFFFYKEWFWGFGCNHSGPWARPRRLPWRPPPQPLEANLPGVSGQFSRAFCPYWYWFGQKASENWPTLYSNLDCTCTQCLEHFLTRYDLLGPWARPMQLPWVPLMRWAPWGWGGVRGPSCGRWSGWMSGSRFGGGQWR